MVHLRHASGFESYYLHLSAFGKGIRAGAHVDQGQLIGRVGATGTATGPHLDYRLKQERCVRESAPRASQAAAGRTDRRPAHLARSACERDRLLQTTRPPRSRREAPPARAGRGRRDALIVALACDTRLDRAELE